MRLRVLLAASGLALTATGCVSGFICSRQGGTPWRELKTAHFVLKTNHAPHRARQMAFALEELREALASALLESVPEHGARVQVVVSAWRRDWVVFSPSRDTHGLFTISRWDEPTILLPPDLGRAQSAVVAHELMHMLTAVDVSRQPPWFREGLATYAESVFVTDEGQVRMGGVLWYRKLPRIAGNSRALLEARGGLSPGGYALAWLLVHYLMTQQRDGFYDLETRFSRGEDPMAAWRTVFPQWDPDAPGGSERLEEALSAYAKLWFTPAAVATVTLEHPPAEERMLAPAEVHDVRLSLAWQDEGRGVPRERMLAEAREALAEDPGTPSAVAILGAQPGADRRALAERATAARPADARTWVLLADALPASDAAGREAALRRAVATDPASPAALVSLTSFLADAHREREALPLARRAVEVAPWDPGALAAAAAVMEGLGHCAEALALSGRAVDSASEHAAEALRKPLVDRRDRLRAACGPAAPPATGPRAPAADESRASP